MNVKLLDSHTKRQLAFYLPDLRSARNLADLFSLFADSSRLRMLSALSISEMCVTDLAASLGMNQTTVSHQLKLLKTAGLVDCTRFGKVIFYRIASPKINEVMLGGVEYLGY